MDRKKVLIVGAGIAGQELSGQFKKLGQQYKLVGFIDDDPKKTNSRIKGIQVLGKIDKIGSLCKKHKINQIVIAIPSASGETIQKVLEATKGIRLNYKILPRTLEIVQGRAYLHHLRNLQITDLLGRAIVKSEQKLFENEFKGKNILVTGAAGSIGSELCRQLAEFSPKKIGALDWSENGLFELNQELSKKAPDSFECILGNIQDTDSLRLIANRLNPHYIFHTAAFKHVPLTQINPLEAIKNNVFGTLNVVEAAKECKANKFTFISSDKAADPINIMGATKLIGEQIISEANSNSDTKFATVRFGNVLESNGSVIPIFRKQIANRDPLTVTHPNMTRFFMSIPEAVQLVLQATVLQKGGEVFILEMGSQVKIEDIAKYMVQLEGLVLDRDIKIEYTGIRPGEKIEEQLFGENEALTEQIGLNNSKIFTVSKSKKLEQNLIAKLKQAIQRNDVTMAIEALKIAAPNLDEV